MHNLMTNRIGNVGRDRVRRFVQVLLMSCLIGYAASAHVLAQSDDPAPSAPDSQSAVKDLLERQKTIKSLLPKFEAVTVCLEGGGGSGSGVIVNKEGLILTAAHVVDKAPPEGMKVRFIDGRTRTCKILGIYNPADAAMAQIIEDGPYEFVDVAAAGSLKLGQTVLATGHPGGFDEQRGIPLRIGHICSFNDDLYACDAPLIGGDSGGPSFNMAGEVIGIHSNISGDLSVNNDVGIDIFLATWDSLLAGERRGKTLFAPENAPDAVVFGASLIESSGDESIRVQSVVPNSPADWSGLQAGDRIVSVNKANPGTASELLDSILDRKFGLAFQLTVQRGEKETVLDVTLMTRPEMKKERQRRAENSHSGKQKEEEQKQDSALEKTQSSLQTTSDAETRLVHYRQQDDDPDDKPKSELQNLLDRYRQNSGRLKIDRDELRRLRDQLGKRVDKLGVVGGRKIDEWGMQFKTAFAQPIAKFSRATFPIFVSGRHSAMAVCVHADGYFVSKASEIEGRNAVIQLGPENRQTAEIIAIEQDLDLVLLRAKIDSLVEPLIPIEFSVGDRDPQESTIDGPGKGTICCAIGDHNQTPVGFGVVSVPARPLNGNTSAYLGADPETVEGNVGARLKAVQPKGPAERAGLKVGDIVESVENDLIETAEDLIQAIESRLPDEKVKLNIRRGDNWLTLPTPLGDKSKVVAMPGSREQGTDSMSTSMNRRRWDFASGIQHDCAISPKHCGSVLVDLQGRVLGVNIARAGRIRSYAIPAPLVADFVTSNIQQHRETVSNPPSEKVSNGDEK